MISAKKSKRVLTIKHFIALLPEKYNNRLTYSYKVELNAKLFFYLVFEQAL